MAATSNAALQVVAWYGSYIGGSAVWTQATGSDPASTGEPPPVPSPAKLKLSGPIYLFNSGMAPIHEVVSGPAGSSVAPQPLGPGPLGPSPNGLQLSLTNNANGSVTPTLHNTESGYPYTLLTNADLNSPVWTPCQVLPNTNGNNQIGFTSVWTTNSPQMFFRAARGFQGINGGDRNAYDIADTDGAVGPSNFVNIANFRIAVYDKKGTLLSSTSISSFFAVPGTGYPSNAAFDAHVVFDNQSACWVACGLDGGVGGSEDVLLAYTTNSSPLPLTNWVRNVLHLAKPGDTSDFPSLGFDTNAVYVSLLRLSGANIEDNVIACIHKPLAQGITSITVLTNADFPTWNMQVAANLDAAPIGGWAWCITKGLPVTNGSYWPGTNYYRRIQWSNTVAQWVETNWQAWWVAKPTNYFDFDSNTTGAPGAPQLGGTNTLTLGASGSRLQMATVINSNLWTCMHVGLDNPNGTYGGDQSGSNVNRSGIQWWKLKLSTAGTPLTNSASGLVCDNATSSPNWYYMPSLAVNSSNVMLLGFSGSSSNSYGSAYYTTRSADGTMMLPPMLMQTGSAYFNDGRRWGDFSYTSLDPADSLTLWTVQAFATTTTKYFWSDWILPVKPAQ